MNSPFVCAVCGEPIMIGRHKSGWRHKSNQHADHRVQKMAREDYERDRRSSVEQPMQDQGAEDDEPTRG